MILVVIIHVIVTLVKPVLDSTIISAYRHCDWVIYPVPKHMIFLVRVAL